MRFLVDVMGVLERWGVNVASRQLRKGMLSSHAWRDNSLVCFGLIFIFRELKVKPCSYFGQTF